VAARGARAQQAAMPVIGFLNGTTPADRARYLTAFRQRVRETGYVEHQNMGFNEPTRVITTSQIHSSRPDS